MIWLRRVVLTMRLAVELIHFMPPAGTTVQRSDEASFKVSAISSAEAGETVIVPLFEETYASPTICASNVRARSESNRCWYRHFDLRFRNGRAHRLRLDFGSIT